MTARLLDGRAVASRLWRDLSDRGAALEAETGTRPRLAVVRFTDSGPTAVYASSLGRAARSVGVETIDVMPPEGVALSDLAARIGALNRDPDISGIVVAQPVPAHLDAAAVLALIDPAKDVDGATPLNAGRVVRGDRGFVPATALAVMAILRTYEIPIAGRRAVVIGRSAVVGRPVAALLLGADATVVVCHRRTRNLARETRRADILVVAAGQPGLVRAEMVNKSAVVIDCGINTTPNGIVGDVDFAAVRPVVSAITPVPGGVGPVTTMTLLEQTMEAFEGRSSAGEPSFERFQMAAEVSPERLPADR
ncbi:MAG TPA: bifunctional 5,10-methylenetetrahydrofolate dehydrogenase/5,10-methenyltetrahydrofolate cyclohydrolase [Candidatus Dormibacteraeota bacterium]|nr:bifunctional 5,10-methylenetetrahydrofolate dehydrogenase/5,10-methenyltetrahydrofolate cyclohydrolase [Candidatus Dormibacteraeota bacterium]